MIESPMGGIYEAAKSGGSIILKPFFFVSSFLHSTYIEIMATNYKTLLPATAIPPQVPVPPAAKKPW